jgi:hypothetical protein
LQVERLGEFQHSGLHQRGAVLQDHDREAQRARALQQPPRLGAARRVEQTMVDEVVVEELAQVGRFRGADVSDHADALLHFLDPATPIRQQVRDQGDELLAVLPQGLDQEVVEIPSVEGLRRGVPLLRPDQKHRLGSRVQVDHRGDQRSAVDAEVALRADPLVGDHQCERRLPLRHRRDQGGRLHRGGDVPCPIAGRAEAPGELALEPAAEGAVAVHDEQQGLGCHTHIVPRRA